VFKNIALLKLLNSIFSILNIANNVNGKKKYIHFKCSKCKNIITFKNPQSRDIFIDCPICVTDGVVGYSKTKKSSILREKLAKINGSHGTNYILYKPLIRIKYSGIIFLLFGMFFLVYPTIFNIKFSSALIIIGCIIIGLIPSSKYFYLRTKDNKIRKNSTLITKMKTNTSFRYKLKNLNNRIDISEKIAIIMIILIVFSFLITGTNNLEIYMIIIYLGALIIRELSVEFIPIKLKKRLNFFIVVFLVIFIVILIKRILNMISI
jgi:hypothetical protein